MHDRRNELMSVFGLLIASLLWGVSYPLTKYVENCPTFYIISLRFIIAGICMSLIFIKHFKNMNRTIIKYAFLLSFCLTALYIFSTMGIKYTTSVRASFFTTLSFVFVPVLNRIFLKVKVSRVIFVSIIICFAGVYMLSYTPDMGGFHMNSGDFICMLACLCGSLHIIFIDKVSKHEKIDPVLFTTMLMIFVAIWGTVISFARGEIQNFRPEKTELITIVLLGIFCSAAAFLLQTVSQKYVPANRAGIIFAMEPASGCVLSVIILGEVMTLNAWIGAFLIMVSLIYMEVAGSRETAEKISN